MSAERNEQQNFGKYQIAFSYMKKMAQRICWIFKS